MRTALALLALLPFLAGCPLPQAVPGENQAGTAAPVPRIVFEDTTPMETAIDVAKNCPAAPVFTLRATLYDANNLEVVEGRWFLDYDPIALNIGTVRLDTSPGSSNPADVKRALAPFAFDKLTDWQGPTYGTHVVELVISNGFYALGGDPAGGLPNRTAHDGYATQTHRWVFRYVDSGGRCGIP